MLSNLPSPKTKQKSKRVGRGLGSGVGGHTTGRGTKGQKSRSGYTKPGRNFEGGQNPLSRRLPKLRGGAKGVGPKYFKSKVKTIVVQLSRIEESIKVGENVTIETLVELGLISPSRNRKNLIKVLFDKDVTKKFSIEGLNASKKAIESIKKAGGEIK